MVITLASTKNCYPGINTNKDSMFWSLPWNQQKTVTLASTQINTVCSGHYPGIYKTVTLASKQIQYTLLLPWHQCKYSTFWLLPWYNKRQLPWHQHNSRKYDCYNYACKLSPDLPLHKQMPSLQHLSSPYAQSIPSLTSVHTHKLCLTSVHTYTFSCLTSVYFTEITLVDVKLSHLFPSVHTHRPSCLIFFIYMFSCLTSVDTHILILPQFRHSPVLPLLVHTFSSYLSSDIHLFYLLVHTFSS